MFVVRDFFLSPRILGLLWFQTSSAYKDADGATVLSFELSKHPFQLCADTVDSTAHAEPVIMCTHETMRPPTFSGLLVLGL
jgi:hypothetical protein